MEENQDLAPPLTWFLLDPDHELALATSLSEAEYGLLCKLRWLIMTTAGHKIPRSVDWITRKLRFPRGSHWLRSFEVLLRENKLIISENKEYIFCPIDTEKIKTVAERSKRASKAAQLRWQNDPADSHLVPKRKPKGSQKEAKSSPNHAKITQQVESLQQNVNAKADAKADASLSLLYSDDSAVLNNGKK